MSVRMEGELKEASEFTYLGIKTTNYRKGSKEIRNRIPRAKKTFHDKKRLLITDSVTSGEHMQSTDVKLRPPHPLTIGSDSRRGAIGEC